MHWWAQTRVCFALVAIIPGAAACAGVVPLETALREPARIQPILRFGEDMFAFRNDVRALNPGEDDLYFNYCFVMTRGVAQFHKFARFDPMRPKLSAEQYIERVQQVVARSPWQDALPADDRVLIPGYANLHDFSRGEERAVKAGLGGKFWTLVHWTNWRVTFPVSREHQGQVAAEILAELRAGRPVLLLVTNWPEPELNHGVAAYDFRINDGAVEFVVYDPNEPERPGIIGFEREPSRFWATQLFDTKPGPIRAFRMYYSPFI